MNQILLELAKAKHQERMRETQQYHLAKNLALGDNKTLYSIATKLRVWLSHLISSNVTRSDAALVRRERYGG